MTGLARHLVILLIAIFLAGTVAVSVSPIRAETADSMSAMPMMPSGAGDCVKCDPGMDMTAGCDLTCALSTLGMPAEPVLPPSALVSCRYDPGEAMAEGRAPSPALTPPRTIILT